MPDQKFKDVELKDFKGNFNIIRKIFGFVLLSPQFVISVFKSTFVCPTEITAFSDRIDEFNKIGACVVGCSCDSHFSHKIWAQMPRNQGGIQGLKYPLMSDLSQSVAKAYSALNKEGTFPVRGLFIIDKNNVIRHMSFNDPPIGRSVDEVLRLIEAIKFFDEHGEVCPINWKPGQKTINVEKSEEFFKNL